MLKYPCSLSTAELVTVGVGAAALDFALDHNLKKAVILGIGVIAILYVVDCSIC